MVQGVSFRVYQVPATRDGSGDCCVSGYTRSQQPEMALGIVVCQGTPGPSNQRWLWGLLCVRVYQVPATRDGSGDCCVSGYTRSQQPEMALGIVVCQGIPGPSNQRWLWGLLCASDKRVMMHSPWF